jgi:hypothetical protein
MPEVNPQEFGRLQAEVAELRRDQEQIMVLLSKMTADLSAVREQLAEARGGWRLMMGLGGAAATLGGFISWAVTHVRWGPP